MFEILKSKLLYESEGFILKIFENVDGFPSASENLLHISSIFKTLLLINSI